MEILIKQSMIETVWCLMNEPCKISNENINKWINDFYIDALLFDGLADVIAIFCRATRSIHVHENRFKFQIALFF